MSPARACLVQVILFAASILIPAAGATATEPAEPRVVFVSSEDGDCEIYTMRPDGSGRVRLTSNATGDVDPALSPDGTEIAWVACCGKDGDKGEVWVMNSDGSNKRQITFDTDEYTRSPAWSLDGSTIVFQRSVGYATSPSTVDHDLHAIRRVDGVWGAESPLVSTAAWEYAPAIAPDGRVAYMMDPDGSGPMETDIWISDSTGASRRPLVAKQGSEVSPSWSPDGTRLTFSRYHVYVYTLSTGLETKLTSGSGTYPDWSSNGDQVIYTSASDSSTMGNLYRLDVTDSSSRAKDITRTKRAMDGFADW